MTNKKSIIAAILLVLLLISTASAATLNVGPKYKYNTIQAAVNAANGGDTIKVASGIYRENVQINKGVDIYGIQYPRVNGFYYYGGSGTINGFKIMKDGVSADYIPAGLIRNNYFYNCGIDLAGGAAAETAQIKNNQISKGTITLYDISRSIPITGTTISNSKFGIYVGDMSVDPTVSGCTFKNCQYAVYFYGGSGPIGKLPTFSGNKYVNNKVNFGNGYLT